MTGPLGEDEAAALCRAAAEAAKAAYAPYSDFPVGAAVLTESGRTFAGCNVENASFGLTVCAERTAVGSAVAAGERRVVAVAVASRPGVTPCGACRQVLAEFAGESLEVLAADLGGRLLTRHALATLLPHSFDGPTDAAPTAAAPEP